MSIGKYIALALVAFFFVAIALGEEVFVLWFFVLIVTGVGYAIGHSIYTSNKARIYVSVGDKKGAVRKAEVSVFMDNMMFRRGITNRGGKCVFFLPTGKSYRFKAKKDNYESSEETLHISDKSMRGISLKLISRKVSVKVTDEHHRPIKDAHLSARASAVSGVMYGHTDVDGKYTFTLPIEPCELTIEKDGYAPAKIQLGKDDTFAAVKLEPKFVKVKIEVVDESGQNIEGASVKIGKKSLVTNEIGVADAKIRVGEQEVSVEKEDFLPFKMTLNISEDFEQCVTLKRRRGLLEVSVVDAISGKSVSANVKLLLFGLTGVEGELEEGRVRFDEVPVGTHRVRSTLEGYHEKEISVEIREGENALEIQLEPLPALSETLLQELARVEAGLQSTVSKLSQTHDAVLPRYYQNYCFTLLQLAKRMPRSANIPGERMVEVIKEVCKEMIRIMEEKKQFYTTAPAEEEVVDFSTREMDFYDAFKELFKDASSFYNEHSNRIQRRIKEVDRKITEMMSEYEISPVASLWKLAKKLAGMREDVVKNAICLLFAEIALDFAERMFVVEEVAERLKKS